MKKIKNIYRKHFQYENKFSNHTNFPVVNDESIMLESSLPLIIMLFSMADVTQITAAICSLRQIYFEEGKRKR